MLNSIYNGKPDRTEALQANLIKIIINHFLILMIILSLPIEYPSDITNIFGLFLNDMLILDYTS